MANQTAICEYCGNEFPALLAPSQIRSKRGRFCSHDCVARSASKIPEGEWGEVVRLYRDELLTSNQIGERYSCTGTVVLKILRRFGVLRYRKPGAANGMFGRTHTPEARKKIRAANLRQFSTVEAREHHAELTIKQIQEGRTGKAFNKLETAFSAMLDEMGIAYQWQAKLGRFVFDFLIYQSNTLIEVHGSFWHADPRFYDRSNLKSAQISNIANDARKESTALASGFRFAQFWGHDIHHAPEQVKKALAALI